MGPDSRRPDMTTPIYTVVTFGSPRLTEDHAFGWTRDLDRAVEKAKAAKGSGTCMNAMVYECSSVSMARSADISTVRDGERIAFCA